MSSQHLEEELHKAIRKRKVQSPFIHNICGADLTDMQLLSKFDEGIRFLFVLLTFSVNMHGLFLLNRKGVFQLLTLFKKSSMNRIENQRKYR